MKQEPSRRWSDLFFVFLVFILILLPYISYKRINMLMRSYDEVNKTNVIKLKLEQTLLEIVNAETGQRGYLLTDDSLFFVPFNASFDHAIELVDEVDSLTAGDATQHLNNIRLHYLLRKRYEMLRSTTRENTVSGIQQKLRAGNSAMDQIRAQVNIMILHQDQLLSGRLKRKEIYSRLTPVIILTVSFISLLIILISFFRIRNDARRLYRLNEKLYSRDMELSQSNIKLTESTSLLNSVLQNTKNGIMQLQYIPGTGEPDFEVIYCNEKIRELGENPEKTVGSRISKILPGISESGRLREFVTVLLTGKSLTFEYHFLSGSHNLWLQIYVDRAGPDNLTITYQDVTHEKAASDELEKATMEVIEMNKEVLRTSAKLETANKMLENKNIELRAMNTELSSFAYVASHDLQEPLRKIRTFTNRIMEKEKENLSPATADYFERIDAAAIRMQKLIDDLLSLSRTTSGQMIFVETDLNKILQEVLRNMKDIIDEKQATITADQLPVLKVIPVQMQQLFQNIISNSLKYSKPDIPPVIKITADHVSEMQRDSGEKVQGSWLKLDFSDNGIGFDPKYSGKIFELFQRLHGKSEYEGTGIGLAICRKIVVNHEGRISATATPGEGATFTVLISETLNNPSSKTTS